MIVMEGIGMFFDNPVGIGVLSILIVLVCCILVFLYFRYNHLRKKVHFKIDSLETEGISGPKEWEQQMLDLASGHKKVKLMRDNFVLNDYNQIAYKKLNRIRDNISAISTDIIALIPAARWLFDNFQMMYREIKKVRTSGTSYEVLPILKNKEYRGFPRIYILAKKMTALSGGHLNEENIAIMLKAYQKEISLTDKELWVLPEILGFCLLENIIKVAEEIIYIIRIKARADAFVRERLGNVAAAEISPLLCELEPDLRQNYSFHAHVIYLLRNMSIDDVSVQKYLEYHFTAKGKQLKPSRVFLEEGKIESYLETNIRALIVSLREINEFDVEKFFEEYSCLEQILSKDPEGIYANMDSESRGMYRGIIVKLAYRKKTTEEVIAKECLELATEGRDDLHCSHHVGTYLLGKGYPILKAKALEKPIPESIREKKNVKGFFYFLSFLLLLLGLGAFVCYLMNNLGQITEVYPYVLVLAVALPLLFGIVLELTNFIFTRRIQVKKIPSLNYLKEIPDQARTYIVMPVIISTKEQGLEYFNRLHKHYLANRQPNLYFALLLDYSDSSQQSNPEDEEIRNALIHRVNELNDLYPSEHRLFSLFIRSRRWNEAENCYMGWERKRGKLEEFNHLLNGASKEDTSFDTVLCDSELLPTFRYVITLDADTDLVRDNASKLVGLMDHPMNRPVMDLKERRVREGYVIIQPSVRNHIADKNSSRFIEMFGGQSGLAHYGAVISDIYQDIFHEAIYTGKGIYDVQAFHQLLYQRIPENRILSHDLLESCYARTAFASNAKVMDNFPGNVLSYVKREHRWIRGDWQLFPWLFIRKNGRNRGVSNLSKWKILDNLRRSMVPCSKILFILMNLIFLPDAYYLWLPFVFFSDLFNIAVLVIAIVRQKIFRPKLALVYKGFLQELKVMFQRAFMELVLTPYRAYMAEDAMIRTLYRLYVSKKNLLRWNTSEAVDSSIINTRKGYFLTMWSSFVPSILLLVLLMLREVPLIGILIYGLLILVWVFAYYLAYVISQPRIKGHVLKEAEDNELLLETARRTWQFFKDFTVKENNYLCPDNYQISHVEKVSDKTSPTNIGLQFLSILSARDFGFETLSTALGLIENLMESVRRLPKWKGHLYNWYHIKTLEILNPAYISTVDSGNFLGHLVALKNGLLEQIDRPILSDCLISELRNSVKQFNQDRNRDKEGRQSSGRELEATYPTVSALLEDITDIWDDLNDREQEPYKNTRRARELADRIEAIVKEAAEFKLKETKVFGQPSIRQLAMQDCKQAKSMIERINELICKIDCLLDNVDFRFLFNEKRMLFHIGYHVSSHMLDAGCYDLMASECSLTSFLAIARGEVPLKHWHKLGRPLTMVNGIPCLVSWSGTMFEYLMPNLVLQEYEGSIYSETFQAAVQQHINYAKETNIPWGISESQYYRFDLNSNYQYKAFGVPKLRLQPVRKNSLVVAPYATLLALEYAGEKCLENLQRLVQLGVFGDYGFYEAIDYNSPDSVNMTPYCIVRSFMAHHQGMNLVAINNFLNQGIMKRRFHAEAMVKATEVLLEEKRQTHLISIAKRGYTIKIGKIHFRGNGYSNRYINSVAPTIPVTNYLSNNKYSLMVTSDGDGFSIYKNMMLYRWRADLYANTGNYIYVKDLKQGKVWSVAYHPIRTEPDEYQVIFSPHMAEFKRVDGDISSDTAVSLSPDHNMEIRKLTLTNHGNLDKHLEITSYLEVVGDTHLAELSHPAFNKLFIESEFLEEHSIFVSKRRSSKGGENPYIMHMVKPGVKLLNKVEYENDRLKFIGRNHTLADPDAVVNSIPLSNHAGFCNDPIMSLRVNIRLGAGETACVSFITGVCSSKEEAVKIGEELCIDYRIDDIFEKFRLQRDIELKYLEITRPQLNAFQDIISPIYYPNAYYRGPQENIRRNFKNQSFLWKFGISGDNPILLLRIKSIEDAGVIKDVLKAYEYLRINRVMVDLIILSEAKHGYMQELDDLVNDLTSSLRIYDADINKPSLFMLHSYQMIPAEIDLLFTVARVVFSEKTGIYFRDIKEKLNELVEE